MMTTATSRRPAGPATSAASRQWLAEITKETRTRPTAAIWFGPPGSGKTSLAAQVPGVVFLTDNMEQGIHTLKERGLVSPGIPVLPPAREWGDVMGMLDALATGEHSHKALALDAMGGLERLCHEEVCRRDHAGDWGKKGFVNYQAGYDTALADWRHFINSLERLRDERNMTIILLGHSKVKPFKNPAGPDYDRYIVDVHEKTWAMTCKWAEMVLFINFEVAFAKGDESKAKAKASGGQVRIAYTENNAAYEAKNRHNLPGEIVLGNEGPKAAWEALTKAIKAGKVVAA
jgi:hypothetical protein